MRSCLSDAAGGELMLRVAWAIGETSKREFDCSE